MRECEQKDMNKEKNGSDAVVQVDEHENGGDEEQVAQREIANLSQLTPLVSQLDPVLVTHFLQIAPLQVLVQVEEESVESLAFD